MPRLGPAKPSISMSSGNSPCAHITSRKLRPVAVTRSRTSPGPGFGRVSAALQPRLANCPGWPMANCAGKPGAGAGKPGRISGAKRPPAARLISGASPAHSTRINGAASSGDRSGAMVSRRGRSPGISFAKTRPSPISAAARASSDWATSINPPATPSAAEASAVSAPSAAAGSAMPVSARIFTPRRLLGGGTSPSVRIAGGRSGANCAANAWANGMASASAKISSDSAETRAGSALFTVGPWPVISSAGQGAAESASTSAPCHAAMPSAVRQAAASGRAPSGSSRHQAGSCPMAKFQSAPGAGSPSSRSDPGAAWPTSPSSTLSPRLFSAAGAKPRITSALSAGAAAMLSFSQPSHVMRTASGTAPIAPARASPMAR